MPILRGLMLASLLFGSGACLAQQSADAPHKANEKAVAPSGVPLEAAAIVERIRNEEPAAPPLEDGRINVQDQLEISVFQVPELSRKVRVNTKGQITLPLIGNIAASGLTVDQLEAEISRRLSATYLQDPQVSVSIEDSPRGRLTVTGAVRSPGVFPLQAKTSLMQAIAMAGGIEKSADERTIAVFRNTPNGRIVATFDLKKIRTGKAPDPEIRGDDIVIVDRNGTRAFFDGVMTALRDVVTFGVLR